MDTERSEREAEGSRAEQLRKRARARLGEERVESRAAAREAGRAAAAARVEGLARAGGWELEEDMREVGGVSRLKEKWRWSFEPAGAVEQLVMFDHGIRGGPEDKEVRAAILESA